MSLAEKNVCGTLINIVLRSAGLKSTGVKTEEALPNSGNSNKIKENNFMKVVARKLTFARCSQTDRKECANNS